MKWFGFAAFGAAALISSAAAGAPLPWGQSSDMVAWQVFAQMVAPAGIPNVKAVEFETWASDDDVFGSNLPNWPVPGGPKHLKRSVAGIAALKAAHKPMGSQFACDQPVDPKAGNFPAGACIGEEVRHNWAAFQYVAGNNLNTFAGLAKAYAGGMKISLPSDSVIVKADWVPIADILKWLPGAFKKPADVKASYYTNTATMNGPTGEYALVGLSIQSKQTKNWVWMTFENRRNPGRCDVTGCRDNFGAAVADVAPQPGANRQYGACAKSAALKALFAGGNVDPIWSNYCLRGSQVQYLTPVGKPGHITFRPSLLANSVVERMNQGVPVASASCITCHAYASFDAAGHANTAALQRNPTGNVQPGQLKGFAQNDFLWGFLQAH